jgi:Ku protein
MRPYWKGYLKLALVSCPIALHAACSTAERIAFRQINKATGNRLRQQLIDEETREPVDPEHKGRGYEVAKGQYLIVEDAELEAIQIQSTHVIDIDSFVPRQQIDQRFFDTPYYVAPNEAVGATPARCATPRTISVTYRNWRSPPTCSRSPRRSWRARLPTSTRKPSATATRRRCSPT